MARIAVYLPFEMALRFKGEAMIVGNDKHPREEEVLPSRWTVHLLDDIFVEIEADSGGKHPLVR